MTSLSASCNTIRRSKQLHLDPGGRDGRFCGRVRFSHRTERRIRRIGDIRVKMTTNKGLVDGRVEGRIRVQVERVENEMVLSCEGNINEGACDLLC